MSDTRTRVTTQDRKDNFLIAFESNLGNVAKACKAVGISRTTFYEWSNTSDTFSERTEEIREGLLDLAETALLENIKDGNVQSIIFFLKTKGKTRGYVERQEIEHTGVQPVTVVESEYVDADNN